MPIEPKTKARNSRVKEIGKPMKMTPIMPASMTRPRISLKLITGSHLDLLAVNEHFARAGCPQALHQLGDALQEQQRRSERDHGPERPYHRPPEARGGGLVERQRTGKNV